MTLERLENASGPCRVLVANARRLPEPIIVPIPPVILPERNRPQPFASTRVSKCQHCGAVIVGRRLYCVGKPECAEALHQRKLDQKRKYAERRRKGLVVRNCIERGSPR